MTPGKRAVETARIGRLVEYLRRAPDHPPPWAEDPRFPIGYLAYSSLLNTIDRTRLRARYAAPADAAPVSAPA